VQYGSHPPGKALHLPDAPQTSFGVMIQELSFSGSVVLSNGPCQNANVGSSKV
jgi:hypothetical protein